MKKPSVTELLDLLNKPALLKWANSIGLKGIDIDVYKNQKAKEGISMHRQIENFILHNIDFNDQSLKENYLKFISDKVILDCEKKIECEYFIGRYDIRFSANDKIYISDFKREHKSLYFENILQLAAYSICDKCDSLSIVSLPDFKIYEVDMSLINKYKNIMVLLSRIYYIKQELK